MPCPSLYRPAALFFALASFPSAAAERPNIVFVFSDDHAYQAVGAYGSMINRTPNIDRLAREGMRFDRALVTNSICAPSRAVILTGKYSHLNGVLDNRLVFDGAQQTFPKLLQAAGYETAVFGKWHLKSAPTGFDHWEVLPGQGAYYNPDMRLGPDDKRRRHTGYVTDVVTDLSLDWLKNRRDPDKPFLLMSQHKAPHRNWMPGPEHLALYDGEHVWEPPTLFDDYSGRASPAAANLMEIGRHMTDAGDLKAPPPDAPSNDRGMRQWTNSYGRLNAAQKAVWDAAYGPKNKAFREAGLQGKDLLRWKYQRYIKDYLRCIASVDDNFGRLLRYLDESGPWPPTPSSSTTPTRASIWASTAGSTSAGCTRNRCGRRCWRAGPASSRPARQTATWCRTSTSPRPFWRSRASQSRPTCRAAAWFPS